MKSYNFEPADGQELIVFVGFPASGMRGDKRRGIEREGKEED